MIRSRSLPWNLELDEACLVFGHVQSLTNDLIRPDFTPPPSLPLGRYLENVYLLIVENLITIRGWDSGIRLQKRRVDLDLVYVLKDGNAIGLCIDLLSVKRPYTEKGISWAV